MHKQEQKNTRKNKKRSFFKIPLRIYPDYKKLKRKRCLLITRRAIKHNNWYGGGYIKLLLEIRKLKREFRKKANHA